jgi:catechol 2,3-dioxygenase-like lactoylglutathione lyase family enzyme
VPVLPAPDPEATAAYYCDVLGFRAVSYLDTAQPHVCLYRDGAEILLTKAAGPVTPSRVANGYGYDAYIVVSDPAAAFEELTAAGAKIAVPLATTDYANREFVVEDPDGRWLGFGLKTKAVQKPPTRRARCRPPSGFIDMREGGHPCG